MNSRARAPLPLVTIVLAAAIVAAFGVELASDGQALCAAYGLVPAHPSLVSVFASPFLHDPSNWLHVGGNLAALVVIGSHVERAIGSLRFAVIYFAGALAGAALHIVVDPTSTIPLVGTSGSLFAVLGVAAMLFGPGMFAFAVVLVATNILHAFGVSIDEGASFGAHIRWICCRCRGRHFGAAMQGRPTPSRCGIARR